MVIFFFFFFLFDLYLNEFPTATYPSVHGVADIYIDPKCTSRESESFYSRHKRDEIANCVGKR